MTDELDDAIETAAKRTREAEERLRQEPVPSPELIADASVVHRRAEDLDVLAEEAAQEARSEE